MKISCTTSIKKDGKTSQNSKAKKANVDICVAILSAGVGARIKSYEPRSLLRINNEPLIDRQIHVINNSFTSPEIIAVFGYDFYRILKKIKTPIRVIENQLYETTNNAESLRLAFNNNVKNNFLFMHGDLLFNNATLSQLNYSESFIIVDSKERFDKKEVGVTITNGKANILSYGLDTKWCQIAHLTGKELKIANSLFLRFEEQNKKMLSFEVINAIIENGGCFKCYEPNNMNIFEIDKIRKDIYEDFNF